MLHLQVVFAGRPHARVEAIDMAAALAVSGVVAVLTGADVPCNAFGLVEADQPVLVAVGDAVRFEGDKVAVVAAESVEAAARGASLVDVTYEDLPVVTDPEIALGEGAPLVHAGRGTNLLHQVTIRRGDVEAALAAADVTLDGEFSTTWQEHAYLQPEAGTAWVDEDGRVVVETAGQWLHEDRRQLAAMLKLPEEQVVVRYNAIGGAFGGREDLSIQHLLAVAAWKLRRPVALQWSREESMRGHHKRHPMRIRCTWGATKDGRITAVRSRVLADGGAYASTSAEVLKIATLFASGAYEVPNIYVDGSVVYTNNIPSGAFRGFGAPQAQFAAESMVTRLAHALGMDPVEFRRLNLYREGSVEPTGEALPPGVSAVAVLEACVAESPHPPTLPPPNLPRPGGGDSPPSPPRLGGGALPVRGRGGAVASPIPLSHAWERGGAQRRGEGSSPHLRYGFGIACGIKNVGYSFGFPEQATATVELFGRGEVERAVVRVGAADVGQGSHLALSQIAAETLRLPLGQIEMVTDDSAAAPNAGSASASRLTLMAGRAVHDAAAEALARYLDSEDLHVTATAQYRPPATTPLDPATGAGRPNYCYGYAAQKVEVEVNTLTGQVRVCSIVSAHDVGRAINRQQVEGQIEGCLAQALGYTLLEDFQIADGRVLTPHLSTYLLPTALDMPTEITPVILELADPNGPFGARGVAEMPLVPFAPAVAAAIHDATGVWLSDLPFTPERVLAGLARDDRDDGDSGGGG